MPGAGMSTTLPARNGLPWIRGVFLFVVWLAAMGLSPSSVPVGLLAAALGALASREIAPEPLRLAPRALVGYVLRFLRQSTLAGFDIARRVFDPRLPLKPGLVSYRCRLTGETACSLFATVMTMVPGTLPVAASADGRMTIHCLDTEQPVTAALAADEARMTEVLGEPAVMAERATDG
jgi:multicomponent Na+:H+ antiporter subunit E